jgi:hypothetical protein
MILTSLLRDSFYGKIIVLFDIIRVRRRDLLSDGFLYFINAFKKFYDFLIALDCVHAVYDVN